MRVLITGSEGLIGSAVSARLRAAGHDVLPFDVRRDTAENVTDLWQVRAAVDGGVPRGDPIDGIIHLAGVSRVVWGERDPVNAFDVNVRGTVNVLRAALDLSPRPWVIYASSREVYGQAARLPVRESDPFAPLNAYSRSKVAAEYAVRAYRDLGLDASVIRFSSVYGSVHDHADRVAPAFAAGAVRGETLRVDGWNTAIDLTYVYDVAEAVAKACRRQSEGSGPFPPVHLVSGRLVKLSELADITVSQAGSGTVRYAQPRSYDVTAFTGDPGRAGDILGWHATTPVEQGMAQLIADFRKLDQD